MKPKLLLGLALVLSGMLFGCAQKPQNTVMPGNEIANYYHLDVKKPSHADRVKLAHDFPKLNPRNQYMVLAFLWPQARCPEFADVLLPLAKLPKESESENEETLCDLVFIRLLELKPKAVRPIICEDLRRSNPLFSLCVLRALPDNELPELDDVLLANLNRQADLDKIPPLIERYATARIMPQVIAFYGSSETGWMCSLQTAILRYWLKHDRSAALKAIEKAVNFRKTTGCYKNVLGKTLHDSFDADAARLVLKFINDSDSEVAADARKLLAQHSSTPHQP